jgi:hypothetical protein
MTKPDLQHIAVQLDTVLAHLTNAKSDAASFSIPEFCERNRISESQYHKLRREGRGPRLMSTGSAAVRISREAEADWIREREREAAGKARPKPNAKGRRRS